MRFSCDCRCQPVRASERCRWGFTLIEMLVVIAIIGILLGLVVLAFPSFTSKQRAKNGAGQLQGWLYLAKQRAFRDGAPRGLRLFTDGSGKVSQCQYTESPEDFVGGPLMNIPNAANPSQGRTRFYMGGGIDLTNGGGPAEFWIVQPGDYLEIQGVGLPHKVVGVSFDNAQSRSVIDIDATFPLPYDLPAPGTTTYKFMRAPRVVGDEPLDLPEDVVIDLQMNTAYPNPLPGGFFGANGIDILFSPSGKVITPGTSTDFIALWVRDINHSDPYEGNPAIIAVHVRSGLVAGTRPSPPPDPYVYVRTGVTPEE